MINLRGCGGAGDRPAGALRPRQGSHRQEELQRDLRRHARCGERLELGLLVDAVSAVITIPDEQIEAPPELRLVGAARLHQRHGQGRAAASSSSSRPHKALDVDEMSAAVSTQAQEADGGITPCSCIA
jgi:hypothetical protein